MGMKLLCGKGMVRAFPPKESAESRRGSDSSEYVSVCLRNLVSFSGSESERICKSYSRKVRGHVEETYDPPSIGLPALLKCFPSFNGVMIPAAINALVDHPLYMLRGSGIPWD